KQRVGERFLSRTIQIDDDVATGNEVEGARERRLAKYVTSLESRDCANRRDDRSSVAHPREELIEQLRCGVGEGRRQIGGAICGLERRAIYVAAHHGYASQPHELATGASVLMKEGSQRVGLLTGRSPRTPDVDVPSAAPEFRNHVLCRGCKRVRIAKEARDVHGQSIDETLVLAAIAVQQSAVLRVGRGAARAHPDGYATPDASVLVIRSAELALARDLLGEILKSVVGWVVLHIQRHSASRWCARRYASLASSKRPSRCSESAKFRCSCGSVESSIRPRSTVRNASSKSPRASYATARLFHRTAYDGYTCTASLNSAIARSRSLTIAAARPA